MAVAVDVQQDLTENGGSNSGSIEDIFKLEIFSIFLTALTF